MSRSMTNRNQPTCHDCDSGCKFEGAARADSSGDEGRQDVVVWTEAMMGENMFPDLKIEGALIGLSVDVTPRCRLGIPHPESHV